MSDYLMHHGILGQKWGVRRFQNADGSLTAAGRKREARNITKKLNEMDKSTVMDKRSFHDHNAKAEWYGKKIDKLSAKKQTDRRIEKIDKLKVKKSVEDETANLYKQKVQSVNSKIENLVNQYTNQGYSIKSELVARNANKGSDYALMALQAVGQMTLSAAGMSSIGFYNTHRVIGTKFKAKYDTKTKEDKFGKNYEDWLNKHPEHKLSEKEQANRKRINDIETIINTQNLSKSDKSNLEKESRALVKQNDKMYEARVKEHVQKAAKTGKMDIDFVEKIQNNERLMNARNDDPKLLSEYEKYLRNK